MHLGTTATNAEYESNDQWQRKERQSTKKGMSRLAEEALKEDEQREKKKQRAEAPKEDEKE